VGLSGEFIAAFGGEASKPSGLEALIARMEREEFDLIAVGRALISNPDWAAQVLHGKSDALKGFQAADLAALV
jgi:2,4-dienoyl-CoA reductase-like NADH-dependent reductase (Old Yellow Enzyme family)